MVKQGQKATSEDRKPKPSGESVSARIPKEQYEIIKKLDGTLGVGESGVVSSIINSWFEQQDWYREIIKEKVKK